MIRVVGTGPGNHKYITPMALEAIQEARVLVGGKRQLEAFATPGQETIEIDSDLNKLLNFIKENKNKNLVVLASGDTGLFSIASTITKVAGEEELEFIPGISSVQLMFARLKKPWHNTNIFSLHGRNIENLETKVDRRRTNVILTGGDWTPQKIAERLAKNDPHVQVAIGKDLSYPYEKISFSTIGEIKEEKEDYRNSIMVIFYGK